METAHEIFRKPLPVTMEFEDTPTPPHYRRFPDGRSLPATVRTWKVHGPLETRDFGLVSDPYGFTDSPDCEFIASGLNSKGPGSVALGRQGNWFLWGFCAPPAAMTEQARRAFVNAIAYMKRFDGQKPLVYDPVRARAWAETFAGWYDGTQGFDVAKHARQCFSPELLAAAGPDLKGLAGFLRDNRPWLRVLPEDGRFDLDLEAKALGIANDDVALLDRCVGMVEKGEDDAVARRLLGRYAGREVERDAAGWRKWLEESRDRLYFSDTGGYRFRVR